LRWSSNEAYVSTLGGIQQVGVLGGIQQVGAPEAAGKSVTPIVFTYGH